MFNVYKCKIVSLPCRAVLDFGVPFLECCCFVLDFGVLYFPCIHEGDSLLSVRLTSYCIMFLCISRQVDVLYVLHATLSSAYCDGATTKQLNMLQLHEYYGRAPTRSDLS